MASIFLPARTSAATSSSPVATKVVCANLSCNPSSAIRKSTLRSNSRMRSDNSYSLLTGVSLSRLFGDGAHPRQVLRKVAAAVAGDPSQDWIAQRPARLIRLKMRVTLKQFRRVSRFDSGDERGVGAAEAGSHIRQRPRGLALPD